LIEYFALIFISSFNHDNSFVNELCQFAKFADIFKDDELGNISTELFLYKLIIDKGMCRILFPMLRSR